MDALKLYANEMRAQIDRPRIAVMWRGDFREPERETHYQSRLAPVVQALQDRALHVEAIAFFEERLESIRERLLGCDGVLVWINPLADGRDRTVVDALLRDVAAKGVWVSAHPDVIAKMGVKDVLYSTRHLSWGADVDLYRTQAAFSARFPSNLAKGPRVLKPHRGNDGQGVVKVERMGDEIVRVQHASDDRIETMRLDALLARMEPAFGAGGRLIDQAFNQNPQGGMVRCYVSRDRVAGFARQLPRNAAGEPFAMASSKAMQGADAPEFAGLRQSMENEWIPGLCAALDIAVNDLPAIWDADFLFRPRSSATGSPYVLCEINVSCVSPFPDAAPEMIAAVASAAAIRRKT